MTKFPRDFRISPLIIQKINSLEKQLNKCESAESMLPLMEEFLKLLYFVTGNLKAAKKFSYFVSARPIERGCNQNKNHSRIGPVGSGKVASLKEQRNSERKLNEAFSI